MNKNLKRLLQSAGFFGVLLVTFLGGGWAENALALFVR